MGDDDGPTAGDPPTITDLIADLEAIRDEHGDLPVVVVDDAWHGLPDPRVTDRDTGIGANYNEKRVEL